MTLGEKYSFPALRNSLLSEDLRPEESSSRTYLLTSLSAPCRILGLLYYYSLIMTEVHRRNLRGILRSVSLIIIKFKRYTRQASAHKRPLKHAERSQSQRNGKYAGRCDVEAVGRYLQAVAKALLHSVQSLTHLSKHQQGQNTEQHIEGH